MALCLVERLGGHGGITRLVTDIVDNHYRNPLIKTRFEQINCHAGSSWCRLMVCPENAASTLETFYKLMPTAITNGKTTGSLSC